jgi:hypothetical protein
MTITQGAAGTGTGTISVSVAASGDIRTTSLVVGGQSLPVRQGCGILPPASPVSVLDQTYSWSGPAGGSPSGGLEFTLPTECRIVPASGTSNWLTWSVTQASGSMPVLQWTAAQNTSTTARSVTITPLGASITFNQAGAEPVWTFSPPSSASIPKEGGNRSFGISTPSVVVAPEVKSDYSWISNVALQGFNGTSGTVNYTVAQNNETSRSGQIKVGSPDAAIPAYFYVNQAGPNCNISYVTTPPGFSLAGGTGQLRVTLSGDSECGPFSATGDTGVAVTAISSQGGGVYLVDFTVSSSPVARTTAISLGYLPSGISAWIYQGPNY